MSDSNLRLLAAGIILLVAVSSSLIMGFLNSLIGIDNPVNEVTSFVFALATSHLALEAMRDAYGRPVHR